jgi:putative acetyltransferase
MSSRVVALLACERARWPLAGDQLYVDLDLSAENLPAETLLAVGAAVIAVSDQPHTGCQKFVARFGLEAMRFVNSPLGRQLQLRGINARVVRPGTIRIGDSVRKTTVGATTVASAQALAPSPAPALLLRPEEPRDWPLVESIHASAFGRRAEAVLVAVLRQQVEPLVSLVAESGGAVSGHILFTPVTLEGHTHRRIMGLAPMAVAPALQRTGIGSTLVRSGLEQCRRLSAAAVVVLGHPEYYPRFGFVPAARFGLRSAYDVPEEVFMALELERGALRGAAGLIRYHSAFDTVEQ